MDWQSLLNQRQFGGLGGANNNANNPPPGPIVSFKAGILTATPKPGGNNNFLVHADPRRGTISLEKIDGITHFMWKDRQTLQVVHDSVVIPGDQTLVKVDTGRPEDRIYLLQFKSTTDRFFFYWMQDPDASKDEEKVTNLNKAMNEPSQPTIAGGAGGMGRRAVGAVAEPPPRVVAMDDLESVLSGLGFAAPPSTSTTAQQQQHPSTSSSVSASATTTENVASGGVVPMSDVKPTTTSSDNNQHTTTAPSTATGSGGGGGGGVTEQDVLDALLQVARTPSLEKVVTSESIKSLLDDDNVAESLMKLLPPGRRTREELFHTTNSPHLISALRAFSKVLNSGHLPSVMANFQLQGGGSHLARGDGIGAFLAAIEDYVQRHPNFENEDLGGSSNNEDDVKKQ
jgi:26S proteasome regulatory subunit N13